MNDREYKATTSGPDVIRRVDVHEPLKLIERSRGDLEAALRRLPASTPVAKPLAHRSDVQTDYLRLDATDATTEYIDDVVTELGNIAAAMVIADASRPEVDHSARLLNVWNRAQRLRREGNHQECRSGN